MLHSLRFAKIYAALLAGWLFLPAAASAQATLAWKLEKGERLFVEQKLTVKQTIELLEATTEQQLSLTRLLRFTVLSKDNDGTANLEMKFEAVKVDSQSGEPKADPAILKNLEGLALQVSVTPEGKVVKLQGLAPLLKKLGQDAPSKPLVRSLVSEETFRALAEEIFSFLPRTRVSPGDRWSGTQDVPLGPLGTLRAARAYTLEKDGQDAKQVRISVAAELSYQPPPAGADFGLKIKDGKLTEGKGVGEYTFDPLTGWLTGATQRCTFALRLQLQAPNGLLPMVFRQTQNAEMRLRGLGAVK